MEGMEIVKAAAVLGAAFVMGIGAIGPALGQGLIGSKACENIGKYPESANKIQTTMLIAMSLVETSAIGIVDKDVCAVREEPADIFCLALDDVVISFLTPMKCHLSKLSFSDIPDRFDCSGKIPGCIIERGSLKP